MTHNHLRGKTRKVQRIECLPLQDFVHQIIAAQLEHSDPPHKLCLAQRDFSNDPSNNGSGSGVNGETFRSVSHLCSAHLLVVSRSYLDSMWPKVCVSLTTS